MIQCPNPSCQAAHEGLPEFCQVCRTPMIYHTLWAVGYDLSGWQAGGLLAGRYRVCRQNALLDTMPAQPLSAVDPVPAGVLPYLRLADLPLHVPRPYAYLTAAETPFSQPLLLLEQAPLVNQAVLTGEGRSAALPSLEDRWQQASAVRQLNWLRQQASLWDRFQEEGVATSLLSPDLFRVEGAVLRLLSLQLDERVGDTPTLGSLGRQWQALAAHAQVGAREPLQALATQLQTGEVTQAARVVASLESALQALVAHPAPVQIALATGTDQGPTRQRNEDACYPPSGTAVGNVVMEGAQAAYPEPLVIVCDGIGGHEGGDVASQIAIQTLQANLQKVIQQPGLSPAEVSQAMRQAIASANDAIAHRNNDEHRKARGRMGTTLVMGLVYPPYLYVAHLGDSRAYRITANTCCQITLDDDVASRETRLGYAMYRDAVALPNGGSLIQALGIGEAEFLYPTVQWLHLEDDCLILLCSDGLSDNDRIETFWSSALAPVLTAPQAIGHTAESLIQVANTYNGHDNVTVGLLALNRLQPGEAGLRFATGPGSAGATLSGPVTVLQGATALQSQPTPTPAVGTAGAAGTTGAARQPNGRPSRSWLGILVALALAAGTGVWLWQRSQLPQPIAFEPLVMPPLPRASFRPAAETPVTVGGFWQVSQSTATRTNTPPLPLRLRSSPSAANESSPETMPLLSAGSILKVNRRQATADQSEWVQVQVCSLASGESLAEVPQESDGGGNAPTTERTTASLATLAQPGQQGWLLLEQLRTAAIPLVSQTTVQQGRCSP